MLLLIVIIINLQGVFLLSATFLLIKFLYKIGMLQAIYNFKENLSEIFLVDAFL